MALKLCAFSLLGLVAALYDNDPPMRMLRQQSHSRAVTSDEDAAVSSALDADLEALERLLPDTDSRLDRWMRKMSTIRFRKATKGEKLDMEAKARRIAEIETAYAIKGMTEETKDSFTDVLKEVLPADEVNDHVVKIVATSAHDAGVDAAVSHWDELFEANLNAIKDRNPRLLRDGLIDTTSEKNEQRVNEAQLKSLNWQSEVLDKLTTSSLQSVGETTMNKMLSRVKDLKPQLPNTSQVLSKIESRAEDLKPQLSNLPDASQVLSKLESRIKELAPQVRESGLVSAPHMESDRARVGVFHMPTMTQRQIVLPQMMEGTVQYASPAALDGNTRSDRIGKMENQAKALRLSEAVKQDFKKEFGKLMGSSPVVDVLAANAAKAALTALQGEQKKQVDKSEDILSAPEVELPEELQDLSSRKLRTTGTGSRAHEENEQQKTSTTELAMALRYAEVGKNFLRGRLDQLLPFNSENMKDVIAFQVSQAILRRKNIPSDMGEAYLDTALRQSLPSYQQILADDVFSKNHKK